MMAIVRVGSKARSSDSPSGSASARAGRVTLERLPYDPDAWDSTVASYPASEVFHTSAWLRFLADSQRAEPVIALVRSDGDPVGHFVGAIVRRFGIRILGSPLRGWTTQTMGFLLEDGISRGAVLDALGPFAFHDLGCLHVELTDRALRVDDVGTDYVVERDQSFRIDLSGTEEEIFAALPPKTRQHTRKAIRSGLRAERATGTAFCDDYYRLLTDVFRREGIAPTYGEGRVRALIDALEPSGQLLLTRISSSEGDTIATGISIGRNRIAVAWGMAWSRAHAALYPIDLLWWERIRYWRARGVSAFDMGGRGDYKTRFGGIPVEAVHVYRSRYPLLPLGRSVVRGYVRARQRVTAAGRGLRGTGSATNA